MAVVPADTAASLDAQAGGSEASGSVAALPKRLDRLTSARALAALSVFAYHASLDLHLQLWPFDDLGYAGVSFFFILSGFILTWSGNGPIALGPFYRRRFARIYPTYAAVLVVTALVYFPDAPSAQLLPSLLAVVLCQAWLAGPGIYALNPPAWSLSVEAAFYIAMPALHRCLAAVGSARRLVSVVTWFCASAIFIFICVERGGALPYVALANPVVRSAEFLLGMVAALELRDGRRLGARLSMFVGCTSVGLALVVGGRPPIGGVELDPAFLVAIVVLAQRDCAGRPSLVLTRRWFVYLGTISYEFYLVHQFVLSRLHLVVSDAAVALPLALGIAAIASAVLYEGLQRPFERLLRSRDEARKPPPRLRRVAMAIPFVLVLATAAVVTKVDFPRHLLPVRSATLTLRARISSSGSSSLLVGRETVDFSSAETPAAGSFVEAGPTGRVAFDERDIGDASYLEMPTMSRAHWAPSTTSGRLLDGPDDPASLLGRVSALGRTAVVDHPRYGRTQLTKYKTTLGVQALRSPTIVSLGLGLPGAAHPLALTIWVVVDPDHLARRLQYREVLPTAGKGTTQIDAEYLFAKFNEPTVTITRPRALGRSVARPPVVAVLFR